mmetsp:Transcript_16705/g.32679  ORF Transcript_16705/g.32679 Transcript_16705/m.32679 type:complete len:267 (-) Transcript_16705:236-1036(-)
MAADWRQALRGAPEPAQVGAPRLTLQGREHLHLPGARLPLLPRRALRRATDGLPVDAVSSVRLDRHGTTRRPRGLLGRPPHRGRLQWMVRRALRRHIASNVNSEWHLGPVRARRMHHSLLGRLQRQEQRRRIALRPSAPSSARLLCADCAAALQRAGAIPPSGFALGASAARVRDIPQSETVLVMTFFFYADSPLSSPRSSGGKSFSTSNGRSYAALPCTLAWRRDGRKLRTWRRLAHALLSNSSLATHSLRARAPSLDSPNRNIP